MTASRRASNHIAKDASLAVKAINRAACSVDRTTGSAAHERLGRRRVGGQGRLGAEQPMADRVRGDQGAEVGDAQGTGKSARGQRVEAVCEGGTAITH